MLATRASRVLSSPTSTGTAPFCERGLFKANWRPFTSFSSPRMPLQILPFPRSEWHAYPRVVEQSFIPGIMELFYPNGLSADTHAYLVTSLEIAHDKHPGRYQLMKVVDTDLPDIDPCLKIVGIARWGIYTKPRDEETMKAEAAEGEREEKERGRTPGIVEAIADQFREQVSAARKKYAGGDAHVILYLLATRPEHHRRGVGAMHLKWGTEKADELGLPAYLEASPMGQPLYKKWGFEPLETLPFDAREHGYSQALTHIVMRRPAKRDTAKSEVDAADG